ncbi:MAG: hypothetical protein COU27_00185 [Candidatus Levybacteria bacterium CG10_big_fil_rev_8_21_14_0_10_36_7]|nr:MAG: hypothetical protein COU27_00185 [Candidatus Levybacteria bacterium CG10_big_fil_rev_8_21_14_0_10_36_7]
MEKDPAPKSQQDHETKGRPISRSSEDFLDELFPLNQSEKSTHYTALGSPKGVDQVATEVLNKLLAGESTDRVLLIKKLPDGGYKIKSYRSAL